MDIRQTHIPYCLLQLQDGRYILLNRNYKPLGLITADWIEYEAHPTAFALKLTPAQAQKLSWNQSPDTTRVYLYNDGTIPTDSPAKLQAYMGRLDQLMKLKIAAPQ